MWNLMHNNRMAKFSIPLETGLDCALSCYAFIEKKGDSYMAWIRLSVMIKSMKLWRVSRSENLTIMGSFKQTPSSLSLCRILVIDTFSNICILFAGSTSNCNFVRMIGPRTTLMASWLWHLNFAQHKTQIIASEFCWFASELTSVITADRKSVV